MGVEVHIQEFVRRVHYPIQYRAGRRSIRSIFFEGDQESPRLASKDKEATQRNLEIAGPSSM